MSDAPSWLTEENISTAAKVAQNPVAQKAAKAAAKDPEVQQAVKNEVAKATGGKNSPPPPPPDRSQSKDSRTQSRDIEAASPDPRASEFVMDEGELKSLKNYHLALRLLYMGVAVFMAVAAVLAFQGQNNIGVAFFAIYVLFFATMICCFEFALTAVARLIAINFGFMYTLSGRVIFLLFVGFMCYNISLWGKVAMGCLYAVGIFHGYVMYKFPRFEEYLRKKHYFEGRRHDASK